MRFYLGTHRPNWLGLLDVPLFVSDRLLRDRKSFPRAMDGWALDSGGFTELSTYGSWDQGPTPREYADRVRLYQEQIGHLDWASPQDWMCEPWIVEKTGLSIVEHQRLTIVNYLRLRDIAPDLPFVPVVQGWQLDDYRRCVDMYEAAGVDLAAENTVGLGSVCRRQHTGQIEQIVRSLQRDGLRLHGYGVKIVGLSAYAHLLQSADSMAWSYGARRADGPLPGCTHKNCANCIVYAVAWRDRLLRATAHRQLSMEDVA